MGCLPFGLLKKKKSRKGKKRSGKVSDIFHKTDDPSPKSTIDVETIVVDLKSRVPSEVEPVTDIKTVVKAEPVVKAVAKAAPGVKPETKSRPSVAEKVASAEAAAILANVKRLEARVKRKEEAKEAKRLREIKSEQDKKDNTKDGPVKSAVPDQNDIKANLKDLDKRCKASKRIQRIARVLHLSDEMAEGLETTLSPFFRF